METDVYLARSRELEPGFPQVAVTDLWATPSGELAPGPTNGVEQGSRSVDIVEEWGLQSFPASDPPANW